ncbi:MAG TPA: TetR/AcrR family transcriptional regulator [Acidimicrobiales bacterium]|nr:TetR/AcrR family transcriptional regulator [Acidimicrobiales bacterium]
MAISDGDPRIARTRSTVIAVVHRLLRTEGPGAVTFGRVSRETGVSRTTLYRHWPGPSELVADAWTRLVPPGPPPPTADLRVDLVAMFIRVRNAVESTTMQRSLPTFLAAALDDPVISQLHAAFVRDRRQPVLERLSQARAEGELDADADLDLLVDLLSGPLFYRQLLRREPTSDRQVADLVDAVLAVACSAPR